MKCSLRASWSVAAIVRDRVKVEDENFSTGLFEQQMFLKLLLKIVPDKTIFSLF